VTGPYAEDGRMPEMSAADRRLIAQHERRIAVAHPPAGTIRILSVIQDDGTWHVDLDVEPVADEFAGPADLGTVRVCLKTDVGRLQSDLPTEVLKRIADRIREL